MTRENAKKMLTNTKIYVNGKSKEIQEKLFEIGFEWSGNSGNNVSHLLYPFLFIRDTITTDYNMTTFESSELKEVSSEDILNIKLDDEFVPKHGDIIFEKSGDSFYIEIFDSYEDDGFGNKWIWCSYYISLDCPLSVNKGGYFYKRDIDVIRLANIYERSVFFSALKGKGLFWNEETKEVEKIKKEHKFNPFDKVLVRDFIETNWDIDFFQEIVGEDIDYKYICLSNEWNFCIPYEGNEELLGTSNSHK